MSEELSGKTIVIFIACGVLTLFLLFIFAKRQILRFTLKSNRGPHVIIGHDAPKALRREIDRRITRVTEIQYEPQLLTKDEETKYSDPQNINNIPPYYYRMKAVDSLAILEREIRERQPTLWRYPNSNLLKFLLGLLRGPLHGASAQLVHQFYDVYQHARQDPTDFGQDEYKMFMELLNQLLHCVKRSSSDSRMINGENCGPKMGDEMMSYISTGSPHAFSHNGKQSAVILRVPGIMLEAHGPSTARNETEL